MKEKSKKYLKLFLKTAVTLGALYYVLTNIDIEKLGAIYARSSIGLLILSLLLFAFSKLLAAFRLNKYFGAIGLKLSEKVNIKLYLLGMYYNLFLPGGIGGDGYKIYLLNKKFKIKTKKVFWAIVVDRVNGMLALFCLTVIVNYFIGFAYPFKPVSFILIPAAVAVLYWLIAKYLNHFKAIYVQTTLISLGVQTAQLLAAWLILTAIGNRHLMGEYLFVFLVSSIVAAFPITIGGVGSREITFFFGAKLMGLDIEVSIALSLMFYIITAITSLIGIYYSFHPRAMQLEKRDE